MGYLPFFIEDHWLIMDSLSKIDDYRIHISQGHRGFSEDHRTAKRLTEAVKGLI